MINSEEKLELFKSSVLSDVKKESEKIISDAKNKNAEMIIDISDKYYVIAEKEREDGKNAIRTEYAKRSQSFKAQARKDVLTHRQELVGGIFSCVEKRLNEFAASNEYPGYIRKAVNDSGVKSGEIRLCSRDFENREELLGDIAKSYTVSCDDTLYLGGLKLIPDGGKVVYDLSFDTALELQRESFSDSFDFKL